MWLFYTGKPRRANINTINTIPQEPGEYQIWNADGNLEYVGITNKLRKCAEEYIRKGCFRETDKFDYLVVKRECSYVELQKYEERHIDQNGIPAGIPIKKQGNTRIPFNDDYYPDVYPTVHYTKRDYHPEEDGEMGLFDRFKNYGSKTDEVRRPFDRFRRRFRIIRRVIMFILYALLLYYLFQLLYELGVIGLMKHMLIDFFNNHWFFDNEK